MDMNNEELPKDKIEQAVFDALKSEPRFELPANFADRVVAMVDAKVKQKEAQMDRWWLAAGIISILGAFIYAYASVEFKPEVGVFTFFSGYGGLVIFGLVFVIALHLVDKLLLKKSQESG
ncbi:MAG TPA: hypothetical protein VK508_10385 [Cyclobacteriaceae bacterium]|nr:hypothetical protein [Cyclobacteriaceae bacterium]